MSIILMTTLFYKALLLQGEIWCWSLLKLKGLTDQIRAQSKDFSAGSQADLNRSLVLPVAQASLLWKVYIMEVWLYYHHLPVHLFISLVFFSWVTATAHATVLFPSVIQSTVFASLLTCQEVRLECDSNKNQWDFSSRYSNCNSCKCNSNSKWVTHRVTLDNNKREKADL